MVSPKEGLVLYVSEMGIPKNAPAGLMFPGDPGFLSGDKTSRNDLMNLAPRIGLAWDPQGNGKTSIRASWGLSSGMRMGRCQRRCRSESASNWSSASRRTI